MRRLHCLIVPLMAVVLGMGCGSSDEDDDNSSGGSGGALDDGGPDSSLGGAGGTSGSGGTGVTGGASGSGATGGGAGTAGTGGSATGGASGTGGSAGTAGTGGAGGGAAGSSGTGGTGPCVPSFCAGKQFDCGDCIDNDNDGAIDMADPNCLGPCDNNEEGFYLDIPGGTGTAPCKLDCYFDDDSGSGNDDCYWDHQCDPLSVAPDYYPQNAECEYTPGAVVPPTGLTCEELQQDQSQECLDLCMPLVPNGCDCFGCCELPAESGNYVWLGSFDSDGTNKEGTCDLASQSDETKCHPCTPVDACLNECGHCELCLGKTELPPDCYSMPDGGTGGFAGTGGAGGTGGSPADSGSGGTGGDPCGGQVCPPGSDPCGLACQPPCPTGYFCLTGCCQKNPS